jgi:predicted RNA-binding Zn-ribbon protein involved in translation (DUF1610 family)
VSFLRRLWSSASLASPARRFAYACNNNYYVNSSGHVVHSPSCGEEHEKRTAECRDRARDRDPDHRFNARNLIQEVRYPSQFQPPYHRASSAVQDIQRRLCKEPYIPLVGDELPPRPKGMHRRTYEKTARRYEAYKTIMDQDLIAALARMMR